MSPTIRQIISFGPFKLNINLKELSEDGRPVRLGARALDLLVALTERAGQVMSRAELVSRVWADTTVDEGSLRAYVAILRKTLGEGQNGARFISNVAGRGYCFVAEVRHEHLLPVIPVDISSPPSPTNLPISLTRMIGRSDLLRSICSHVALSRLVSIVGPGGVGKTTLALAIGQDQLSRFPQGVWLVDLSTISDGDKICSALAAAIDVPAGSANSMLDLSTYLRSKKAMVVFDNCEHMLDSVASATHELLRHAPDVHILATSREPLRIAGEFVKRLHPLDSPKDAPVLSVPEALAYSSVQLFVERAIASVESFELTKDNVVFVSDICRRLDGIPLAIELAAARIDAYGARGLHLQLDDRFNLLSNLKRGGPSRHRTLRALTAWSYERLPEDQQILMRRLAAFAGSFDMDAAISVAQATPLDEKMVTSGVARLAARSLLATDVVGDHIRYRMLFSTRAFALEMFECDSDRQSTLSRHVNFVREVVARAEVDSARLARGEWLATYRSVIDDVRIALDWALSDGGDFAAGIKLASSSVSLGHALFLYDEFRTYVEKAIARLSEINHAMPAVEMRLRTALASLSAFNDGYTQRMVTEFEIAYQIVQGSGDAYEVEALNGIWIAANTQGDHPMARKYGLRIAEIAEFTGDAAVALIADRLLATSEHHLGKHAAALARIERVISRPPVSKALAPPFPVNARLLLRTISARIHWIEGHPDKALAVIRETIEAAKDDDGQALPLILAWGACPIALWCGHLDLGKDFIDQMHQRSTELRLHSWLAHVHNFRQILETRQRRMTTDDIGLPTMVVVSDVDGLQRDLLRTLDEGVEDVDSLARVESGQVQWCGPEILRLHALRLAKTSAIDSVDRAMTTLMQAKELAQDQGALSWELRIDTSLAAVLFQRNEINAARAILSDTYGKFREGFATADLIKARALLAKLNHSCDR